MRRDNAAATRPILEFVGRSFDSIVRDDGERVSPYRLDVLLEQVAGLKAFEVVQQADGTIDVKLDVEPGDGRSRHSDRKARAAARRRRRTGAAHPPRRNRSRPGRRKVPPGPLARTVVGVRILSLTYEYPPIGGGGSVVAAAVNQELVRLGHEVIVLTSGMRGLHASETVEGVTVVRTSCVRRHRHYTTAAELFTTLLPAYRRGAQLVRSFQPDVIHTHFVVPSGVLAWALSRRFGVPYVLTAHGSDVPGYNPDRFEWLHALLGPAWRGILDGASFVTSPSRFLADLIRRHGYADPIDIVPNGHHPQPCGGGLRRKQVLVVARMFPRKGVQHFIEAIAGLGDDWEFVIAGDGPHRGQLEEQASSVGARVRFTGFLDRAALRSLYESSQILVFPSIQENFPMVLLEAMDAGCAIVTTNAEGCAEVVGDAGLVVPKGESQGIRAALERLMHDPGLVQRLSVRGKSRAAMLAWPNIVVRYGDLLQAAATGRVPSSTPPAPLQAPLGPPIVR